MEKSKLSMNTLKHIISSKLHKKEKNYKEKEMN